MRLRNLRPRLGYFDLLVLGVVIVASPALLVAERLTGREFQSLPLIGLMTIVSLILFARVAASFRESARLGTRSVPKTNGSRKPPQSSSRQTTRSPRPRSTARSSSWNRASERLYGYTAEEMVGSRIHQIIEPERHAVVDETLAAIGRGVLVEPHEATGVRKDGSIMPVALTVSLVRGRDGDRARSLDDRPRHLRSQGGGGGTRRAAERARGAERAAA